MKILYHHRIRSKDGQYVHIEELTDALRKLGHEIVMVGPGAIERENFGTDAGLVDVLKRFLHNGVYETIELAYGILAYRRLRKICLRQRPDCLYERYSLFLPAGVWLKKKYGLSMLLEVNSPLAEERNRFGGLALKRLARWTERFAWRNADYVLPVTRVLADHIRAAGVPEERIAVIANGTNLERFGQSIDSTEAKARLGLQGRLVLGFTGFVRSWHGLDRAIDYVADDMGRRNLHILVLGDGPARANLEAYAQERNVADRLTICGIVSRDQVADHVAAFDIALQPDVVPYASPLKLFEYMALGRAIVAPAMPNILEVLRDNENALLFDPKAPGSFRHVVEQLCDDEALRQQLGAAARRTIIDQGLTWQHNARRIEELFRRLGVGSDVQR